MRYGDWFGQKLEFEKSGAILNMNAAIDVRNYAYTVDLSPVATSLPSGVMPPFTPAQSFHGGKKFLERIMRANVVLACPSRVYFDGLKCQSGTFISTVTPFVVSSTLINCWSIDQTDD